MANWSDLPYDLLVLIAKRICLIDDFAAFGGVCQSWRLAANKQNFITKLGDQVPWLMLAENEDDDNNHDNNNNSNNYCTFREFYSLSYDRVYKVTLPEASGKRCFSSQGWLLTIAKDLEVNLLQPLSRSQIWLPNLSSFPDLEEEKVTDMQNIFIDKVVLSSSPSTTSDYVVMVLYGASTKLAFYRAGDDAWNIVDTRFAMHLDVIYYNSRFYAVDSQGRVLVCDVNGPNPTTAEVVSVLTDSDTRWIDKLYLVESRGKLLVVSREGTELRDVEEGGSTGLTYGATRFQVFELDDDASDGKWKEVKSIGGDVALFVGDNSSFSIDISNFTGCNFKANSIYFTDDCKESYHDVESVPNGGGRDMGVYNLVDGSFDTHFKGESLSRITPPLWVVPTF